MRRGITTLQVRARNLRPGDICRGSQAEVLSYPRAAVGGKVNLAIRRKPNRKPVNVTWGASTTITVDRPAPTC